MPAVDTTPAGAAANAYISTADVDTLAGADVGRYASHWATLAQAARERAVIRATRDVDAYVGYLDPQYDPTQALLFPRYYDMDDAGAPVVPQTVVMATYEQSIYVAKVADLIDDDGSRRARGMSNFSEQNVSGALLPDSHLGQYAPRMRRRLDGPGIERGGAVVGTIVQA